MRAPSSRLSPCALPRPRAGEFPRWSHSRPSPASRNPSTQFQDLSGSSLRALWIRSRLFPLHIPAPATEFEPACGWKHYLRLPARSCALWSGLRAAAAILSLPVTEGAACPPRCIRFGGNLNLEADGKVESGSPANLAAESDASVHAFHDSGGDRQSQPRPAVYSAGRAVRLHKGLKQPPFRFGGN